MGDAKIPVKYVLSCTTIPFLSVLQGGFYSFDGQDAQNSNEYTLHVTFNGNTVKWYSHYSSYTAYNASGHTYYYIALG